jgi:adenylate cyclase class 2
MNQRYAKGADKNRTDYNETEVKLYVPHLELIQVRLEQLDAKRVAPRVFERNVRYENAAQTLTPAGIVLRLRQDTQIHLTYKDSAIVQDGIVSRFEAEVEVSDFGAMETILAKLGYTPYMVYEKYRTTYELDDAEIVLDELPFGNFVEIEGDANTIERVISRLELEGAKRYVASYVALFDNVRRNLGLPFTDLTFANFEGVVVSEEAFKDN